MYHFHPISEVFVFLLFPIVFICHLPCLSSAFLPSHLMPFFFILIIHYMIHHLAALQLYKQRLAYLFFYIAKTTVLFRIDCEIQGVLAQHGQRIQDRNLVKTNKSSFQSCNSHFGGDECRKLLCRHLVFSDFLSSHSRHPVQRI